MESNKEKEKMTKNHKKRTYGEFSYTFKFPQEDIHTPYYYEKFDINVKDEKQQAIMYV